VLGLEIAYMGYMFMYIFIVYQEKMLSILIMVFLFFDLELACVDMGVFIFI